MSFLSLSTFSACIFAPSQALNLDCTANLVESAASQLMRPMQFMTSSKVHSAASLAIIAIGGAILYFDNHHDIILKRLDNPLFEYFSIQLPKKLERDKITSEFKTVISIPPYLEKSISFLAKASDYGSTFILAITALGFVARLGARAWNPELKNIVFTLRA